MQDYVSLSSGHMEFLIQTLDGDPGTTHPPALPPLPTVTDSTLAHQAVVFLRRTSRPIEPRKQWPPGGIPQYDLRGRIPSELQPELGKALCIWGDSGWGGLVRTGKYHDRRFSDELVDACVRLIGEWNPQPAPAWVTSIPSLRHPDLVPSFATRLASRLDLPFLRAIEKVNERPRQKEMQNSTQQARNLDGALRISVQKLPAGPVLLVDDMVDSRWTLTVAAWLLRLHKSGQVWPLALALAGPDR